MTTTSELWDYWCEQAASKAGISVGELRRRLAADEVRLEMSVVVKGPQHDLTPEAERMMRKPDG